MVIYIKEISRRIEKICDLIKREVNKKKIFLLKILI